MIKIDVLAGAKHAASDPEGSQNNSAHDCHSSNVGHCSIWRIIFIVSAIVLWSSNGRINVVVVWEVASHDSTIHPILAWNPCRPSINRLWFDLLFLAGHLGANILIQNNDGFTARSALFTARFIVFIVGGKMITSNLFCHFRGSPRVLALLNLRSQCQVRRFYPANPGNFSHKRVMVVGGNKITHAIAYRALPHLA